MNNDWQRVLDGTDTWCVVEGDCLPILDKIPVKGVDHVITDPPYDARTHANARKHGSESLSEDLGIDFKPISASVVVEPFLRVAKRWVLAFSSFEMVGDYSRLSGASWIRCGIYRRTNGAPQFTGDRPGQAGEAINIMHRKGRKVWNGGGSSAFWSCSVERTDRKHPTQKPITLMMELVKLFSDPGDIILDPFCGSGTTGVAAVMQGRRFIGVEIDPKYAAVAHTTVADAVQKYAEEESQRAAFQAAMQAEDDSQRSTFDLFMGVKS